MTDEGLTAGSTLDEREAALAEREAAMAEREARIAPREREYEHDPRGRAGDSSVRMERQSMDYYSPPNQLQVPRDPEYHYRWVAESVNGSQTPRNVQQRLQEGYARVRADQLPEDFLVDEDIKGDGLARTSGLLLMRIPLSRKRARDDFFTRRSRERANSVDELQGVAGSNALREDRGTRSLTGAEAARALQRMSQN